MNSTIKKLTLLVLVLLALTLPAHAQNSYTVSSPSTTTKFTLQLPSTGVVPTVSFPQGGRYGASVSCAAAQTATVSWNGTAATATAVTTAQLPPTVTPSAAKAYTNSDVGTGTASAAPISVQAGVTQGIDLGLIKLGPAGTGNNITITTTGACTIAFYWSEQL